MPLAPPRQTRGSCVSPVASRGQHHRRYLAWSSTQWPSLARIAGATRVSDLPIRLLPCRIVARQQRAAGQSRSFWGGTQRLTLRAHVGQVASEAGEGVSAHIAAEAATDPPGGP